MDIESLLADLRQQPFYNGQILRVRHFDGRAPQTAPIEALLERVPRLAGGSGPTLLSILGLRDVYAQLIAGLANSFPTLGPGGRELCADSIAVAPFSQVRELLWQLVCLIAALDEGSTCLVLCPTELSAREAHTRVADLVIRADVSYALHFACVTQQADFTIFDRDIPRIVTASPEMLRTLLCDDSLAGLRDRFFSALARVALPSMECWSAVAASHASHLMRQVHVEGAIRGMRPSLVATLTPDTNALTGRVSGSVQRYVSMFYGRDIPETAFARSDSVEAPPAVVVNYTGGLVRNPENQDEWIRQDPSRVASDLIGWVVGEFPAQAAGNAELHYVLDVSGSMEARLTPVRTAIMRDLEARLTAGSLRTGDRVKLTQFHHDARTVFDGSLTASLAADFSTALSRAAGGGGTDVSLGLGTALASAIKDEAHTIEVILFSDGESPVSSEQHGQLIQAIRNARTQGRVIRLLYVTLDMQPPPSVRNLVHGMGGRIVETSTSELERATTFDPDGHSEGAVVVLSGENGLPASIVQRHLAGKRRLLYTRRAAELTLPASGVAVVVANGRFGSVTEILNQVRHLARERLAVFVISEAEAWSRVLAEDLAELDGLGRLPSIYPDNSNVGECRLREYLGTREVEDFVFRYLEKGATAYDGMMSALGFNGASRDIEDVAFSNRDGFQCVSRGTRRYVRQVAGESPSSAFDTYTIDRTQLEGAGIRVRVDSAIVPIVFHSGALVDAPLCVAEVETVTLQNGGVSLRQRTCDRVVPLFDDVRLLPKDSKAWCKSRSNLENWGELGFGDVAIEGTVPGIRVFERGDLDDKCRNEGYSSPKQFSFQTRALCWAPCDADESIVNGLSNLLRLALPSVVHYAEQSLLVVPTGKEIWLADLAPGGNGCVDRFVKDRQLLLELLRLGGRIALECPCEGGLAGCSDNAPSPGTNDLGCPRCSRVVGPVLLDGAADRFRNINKRSLLNWLAAHRHLPASGAVHIAEKYQGVQDARRVSGEDVGSRRGCMRIARRILADRLGLRIEDSHVAGFRWLKDDELKKYVGLYLAGDNVVALAKGLREWVALDVTAHEFFHNMQFTVPGLFNLQVLGPSVVPPLPFDGKLFLEGSAMWAESHVVDALAIRSALTSANLRHGDEYGEGFRVLKYIEERHGGVGVVLRFLSTGDINDATAGKVRDLAALYVEAGLRVQCD